MGPDLQTRRDLQGAEAEAAALRKRCDRLEGLVGRVLQEHELVKEGQQRLAQLLQATKARLR